MTLPFPGVDRFVWQKCLPESMPELPILTHYLIIRHPAHYSNHIRCKLSPFYAFSENIDKCKKNPAPPSRLMVELDRC
ncbi:MAG: hypothetical protein CVV01_05405 [Firmicutes bacterium HGW-Firmicutes-6]|nr:MAG: hypothetical protein CVV01_05405 [Firmicutes bacterium HGW-Firmicutes-6]